MQRRSRGGRQSRQTRNPARAEQKKLNPTRVELNAHQGEAEEAESHQGGTGTHQGRLEEAEAHQGGTDTHQGKANGAEVHQGGAGVKRAGSWLSSGMRAETVLCTEAEDGTELCSVMVFKNGFRDNIPRSGFRDWGRCGTRCRNWTALLV